jgi:hypothetical protein
MRTKRGIVEALIYAAVIALSLAAFGLVVSLPVDSLKPKPVYQGF